MDEGTAFMGADGERRGGTGARAKRADDGPIARREPRGDPVARAVIDIASAASADESLRLATERARSIVGAHQAVSSLSTDESGSQRVHTTSLSDKYAAFRDFAATPDGSGIYSLVVRLNRPLRMTQKELEAHPAWRGFGDLAAQHPPMRGWIAVPLIARDGRNLGLLQVSDKDEDEFSADDEAILVQLAEAVSVVLENQQLIDELRRGRTRLQGATRRLLTTHEEERARIARVLHDEIGNALAALKLDFETAQRSAADAGAVLAEGIAITDRTLEHVRSLALELRPSLLDDLGLFAAVRWYLDRQAQGAGWHAQLGADPLQRRPPPEVETVCFRVVQEALRNAARHATAQRVWLELRVRDGELHLSARDDGAGFDVAAVCGPAGAGCRGLLDMEERVASIGGRLEIASTVGEGTTILARLPLRTSDASEGEMR